MRPRSLRSTKGTQKVTSRGLVMNLWTNKQCRCLSCWTDIMKQLIHEVEGAPSTEDFAKPCRVGHQPMFDSFFSWMQFSYCNNCCLIIRASFPVQVNFVQFDIQVLHMYVCILWANKVPRTVIQVMITNKCNTKITFKDVIWPLVLICRFSFWGLKNEVN